MTRTRGLALLAGLLFTFFGATAAFAFNGYATANVNMRAGPGVNYPRVLTVRAGAPLTVYGCVRGGNWCDVAAYSARGWVSGRYISGQYGGRRVIVPNVLPQIGVPIITFGIDNYWNRHYRDRPFYRDWRRDHYRPHEPRYNDWRPPRRDVRPPVVVRPRPDDRGDWRRDRDNRRDRDYRRDRDRDHRRSDWDTRRDPRRDGNKPPPAFRKECDPARRNPADCF
ncbi:hypothetical protein HDIA_3480 [Hartmannibacter diazotrophicus]|uniref:SH3b domain-containing protein n=1 Tax=Hartmannibacter diazotrophicus TaxID=1482074 RepID=A0A2C9DBB0_9HYPH|nr:SH3 domain-containing protein [Hartmannibacter diazotrophicus]SON57021.1 hypothetical protein HDIA_3480 [Hartmannibacter diazotrophicus]